ncbi:uncharacterized protein PFL1_01759 [Pseudozyma flocculosa PF-1]|uniref:uncharacterized protein n=1 Tax=Pseudozyma flocculosa PF-1 TaxID=1277687 RepID=UPI000456082F|nr:uncharacterized protein PFL1_01759 [Pseudozyma flocculosa PF-1]EPQ30862.1 hypothetical protein PFL1_01759 [Pseudozyma flocculosa PF-1]
MSKRPASPASRDDVGGPSSSGSSKKRRGSATDPAPYRVAADDADDDADGVGELGKLTVLSWNLNGIQRHLPSSSSSSCSSSSSRTLHDFFRNSTPPSPPPCPPAPPSSAQQPPPPPLAAARREREADSLRTLVAANGFPSIVCLQEVQLRPSDPLVKEMQRAFQPSSTASTTATAAAAADVGLGYTMFLNLYDSTRGKARFGIATFVRDDVLRRFRQRRGADGVGWRTVEWDNEGRVGILDLGPVSLYNVYALNSSSYAFHHPTSGARTRHERKLEFHTLLASQIDADRNRNRNRNGLGHGHGQRRAVLCGDFNVTPSSVDARPPESLRTQHPHAHARRHWLDTCAATGLVDVYRLENQEGTEVSWFNDHHRRGVGARVDYVLADSHLVDCGAVRQASYRPDQGHRSDHCPLVFTLDLDAARRVGGSGGDAPLGSIAKGAG